MIKSFKKILSHFPLLYRIIKKLYLSYKKNVFFIPISENDLKNENISKKFYPLNFNNFQKFRDKFKYFLIFRDKKISYYSKSKIAELSKFVLIDKVDIAYDGDCPNYTEIVSCKVLDTYIKELNIEHYPYKFFYIKDKFKIKNIGSKHRSYNFNGTFLLPAGGKTIGDGGDVTFRLNFIPDLSGKSFLDIGSEEGYAVFDALKKNAKFAKGLNILEDKEYDFFPEYLRPSSVTSRKREEIDKTQNFLIKEFGYHDKNNFKFEYGNIYNLNKEKFDFVFCFGVLYHLKNPYKAIENLYTITNETLIIETQGIRDLKYLNAKIDLKDGFIRHSPGSLKFLLKKAGFKKVSVLVDAHDANMEVTNIVLKAIKN